VDDRSLRAAAECPRVGSECLARPGISAGQPADLRCLCGSLLVGSGLLRL